MSDVVFDTDLHQRSLVEASAGTGKTYALAGLFARAVIVERLRVPQVLAVTYTVAATQELQERVRLRLQQALALAQDWREGDPERRDGDAADVALLRRLLHQALQAEPRESLPALRLRLARALREMDLAVIATIHGFCQRVLREHALETAQPLLAPELEPANAAARERLAADLWRAFSADADGAAFLRRRFGSLNALARALRDLLAVEPLRPPSPGQGLDDPRERIRQHWQALCERYADCGDSTRAALEEALQGGVLHGSQYKPEHVAALWAWLQRHAVAPQPPAEPHDKLHKYTPAALAKGTLKAKAGRTPQSPLFAAIEPLLEALRELGPWQEARDLQRLHALREEARRRDRARKQAFNLRDYDDLIGDLHAAVLAEDADGALATALRKQFPCVLVDEFQDTDARQWQIFARLFGHDGLVLVGDPKQAIYRFRGGDVNTYVAAAASAVRAAPLDRNFRSRPCVIAAINTLFGQAPVGVLGPGIDFHPTQPGGRAADMDLQVDGAAAPALHCHVLPAQASGRDYDKPASLRLASELCADAILQRLQPPRGAGACLLQDAHGGAPRLPQPRDVAVLVRDHAQAAAIRQALARRAIPAVVSGRESLYRGEEAQDLIALLLALLAPGDDRRLRMLLATPLLGWDAARILALEADGDALRDWQQTLVAWRARWERHGPQAMLADVLARQAERLLRAASGERRLSNYLQLGELLQAQAGRNLGTQGQLDALRHAIEHADIDNEAQQPRLESDAGRVQILTLHKSKGLEFPLVYLPFAGIGRMEKVNGMAMYTDDSGQRVRQCKTEQAHAGAPDWNEAKRRHLDEERAEDMRLLYVGLTRASQALWLCCGPLSQSGNAALTRLLGGTAPAPALVEALGADLVLGHGLPAAGTPARLAPLPADAIPAPRAASRHLQRDWWIHSFSQLHRQSSHGAGAIVEARPADDEVPVAALPAAPKVFAGSRFGNAVHQALEHVDFAAWRDHAGETPPAGQAQALLDALLGQGYAEKLHEAGVRELTPLIARTLNAPLPEGVRLCQLPPQARRVELEFHLALRGASTQALLALLQAHGLVAERRDFGPWTQLSGLLNGKIDLTYRHGGRVYVIDYKSNDLPAYDAEALAQAMAASEYDLQALLYTLAVHRWLRLRLGAAYDYERDFGGVRYLFCRGLDPAEPAQGLHAMRYSRELVEAVDDLLVAPQEAAA